MSILVSYQAVPLTFYNKIVLMDTTCIFSDGGAAVGQGEQ